MSFCKNTHGSGLLVLLLGIAIVLYAPPANAATYSGGDGTAGTPYLISTVQDLQDLSNPANSADWDKHFLMTNNIDMAGVTGFTPIAPSTVLGDWLPPDYPFTGVFDGGGYEIQNLVIDQPLLDYVGLFGWVVSPAQISNLGYTGGSVSGNGNVGGLMSQNEGTITACYTTGTVSGSGNYVGGLVASGGGTIVRCYSECVVSVESAVMPVNCVGGLVGICSGTIEDCYATGDVTGFGDYVGGLVGDNFKDGTVTGCYATGDVTTISAIFESGGHVGGLVGAGEGAILRSYATGNVFGAEDEIGGLVGACYGAVSDSYATGNVSGLDCVGGLVGDNGGGIVTNCYAIGSVTGSTLVGGLVGGQLGGTTSKSFWDTTVGGPDNGVGVGLPTVEMKQRTTFESMGWDFTDSDGDAPDWFIVENVSYPTLYLPVPISSVAGLQQISANPASSYFLTQDIDASETRAPAEKASGPGFLPLCSAANPFTGTLDGNGHRIANLYIDRPSMNQVGLFSYIGAGGEVHDLGLEGVTITGGNQTGGLSGVNAGRVRQCYVRGTIVGANSVGGLVGENQGSVNESYAAASLTGATTGGLIGVDNGGVVSASFWDTTMSGTSFSGGGTGLPTASMHLTSTYSAAAWGLSEHVVHCRGFLLSLLPSQRPCAHGDRPTTANRRGQRGHRRGSVFAAGFRDGGRR